MGLADAQRTAIYDVITALTSIKTARKKRPVAEMFMDLVDKDAWADYYEVIPAPRCINAVLDGLKNNTYDDPLKAYEDLSLVFLNALYYNEATSQIVKDALMLKEKLESEWKQRSILPSPPSSLPASSAQKIYGHPVTTEPGPSGHSGHVGPGTQSAPSGSSTSLVPIAPAPAPARSPAPAAAHTPTPAVATPSRPPLLTHSSSPHRQSSPDMEIDVGGTPEPESLGVGDEMARDGESDAIVQQLERGLPRWDGFGDYGWMSEGAENRWLEVVVAIKGHKDAVGNRYSAALEAMPEESSIPYLSLSTPLSLKLVESRARAKSYSSNKAFDKEMAQLFEKGRRWHEPGSDAYGHVLLLQRLYQAITSTNPPPGPPYTSTTNFASLRAGPGTARPLHSSSDPEKLPGVTTFRVSTKDRTFVDEVQYKGWSVRLADWLHLSNPDDPSKPIVAQVFKCYVSDEPTKKGQPGVTVCWYYRPEQTFHPAQRQFWEGEVFKTSHFADHPVEDIIEKIACQFTARHIRGRPRPPSWYLGWPLYVCDSRYNDRERIFVKIKNWNSCVPEEVRKSTEFMPIYPFERMIFPRRFGSPFLKGKGVKGPGGIGGSIEKGEGERVEGGGTGRKRSKRTGAATDISGPSKGLYVGDRVAAGGGGAAAAQVAYGQQQPAAPLPGAPLEDRSIVTAAGGLSALGGNAAMEKLPPETAKYFDRDPETNEVLWFAAPPLNIAHTPAPRYSLKYLHWLATKRKAAGAGEDEDAMDVDEAPAAKRPRTQALYPTVTETLHALFEGFSQEEGTVS